jgi:hypothetical protein
MANSDLSRDGRKGVVAMKKIEVTRSVGLALKVVQYLFDNIPSWGEFEEFDLLLGDIVDDTADGPCGLDNLAFSDREVYVNLGLSGATFASIGLHDGGAGWRVHNVGYYNIEDATGDDGISMRGKNGWRDKRISGKIKNLPQMVIDHLNDELALSLA